MDASWRMWVKDNIARGCNPVEIRDILLGNNFSVGIIKKQMGEHYPDHVPLPGGPAKIISTNHEALTKIRITREATPVPNDLVQIYMLDDFMTPEECEAMIAVSTPHLVPSPITIETEDDKYFRTSSTCHLTYLKDKIITDIDQRIAERLGINLNYSEGIQAQRYEVGQQFKPHTDFFEPGSKEYAEFASEQGNRTWTFMVYLNETPKGGGTHFPNLEHTFYPKIGRAVVWNNLYADGTPNRDTLHAGMPVEEGHKVIITKWFRERGRGKMLPD